MKSHLVAAAALAAAAAFAPATYAQELRWDPELGRQIAEQGNRALRQIQAENRAAVRSLSPRAREHAPHAVFVAFGENLPVTPVSPRKERRS